eukprot:6023309-Pyramimonas_sp.AAC.1
MFGLRGPSQGPDDRQQTPQDEKPVFQGRGKITTSGVWEYGYPDIRLCGVTGDMLTPIPGFVGFSN